MAEDRIKCPVCAELIKPGAKKCRFCGEWLGGSMEAREEVVHREPPEPLDGEQESWREDSAEETEGKSPEPETVKKIEIASVRKKRPFPWLRTILFISYVAIIAVLVCSERTARQMLRKAKAEEETLNVQAAFDTYSTIIHKYPFSLAVIETQRSLQGLSESHGYELPGPSWLEKVETVLEILQTKLDRDLTVCEVYLLPFVAWPACAVLLALVFLTRILRPGTAFLVLIFLAVAVGCSVIQLSWYETVLPKSIAKGVLEVPVVLYSVTYALLVITALMTLTATRKRRRKLPTR